MSTLKEKAQDILNEKIEKIIPENIKKDIQIFDVVGTLDGSGGNELPDPGLPKKLVLSPLDDYEFRIETDLEYRSDYIFDIKLNFYDDQGQVYNTWTDVGNTYTDTTPNNKLILCGQIYEYVFNQSEGVNVALQFMFILENYYPKKVIEPFEKEIPNIFRETIMITNQDGNQLTNELNISDFIIKNSNDVDVTSQINKGKKDDYWTDTFYFDLPIDEPIDTYTIYAYYDGDLEKQVIAFEISSNDIIDYIGMGDYTENTQLNSEYLIPNTYSYTFYINDNVTSAGLIGNAIIDCYSDNDYQDYVKTMTIPFESRFEFREKGIQAISGIIQSVGYTDYNFASATNEQVFEIAMSKSYDENIQQRVNFNICEKHPTIPNMIIPAPSDLEVVLYKDEERTIPYGLAQTYIIPYYNAEDPEHIISIDNKVFAFVDDIGTNVYITINDPYNRFENMPDNRVAEVQNQPSDYSFEITRKTEN